MCKVPIDRCRKLRRLCGVIMLIAVCGPRAILLAAEPDPASANKTQSSASPSGAAEAAPEKPAFLSIAHTKQVREGFTLQVDDRLLAGEHAPAGEAGLTILSHKLAETVRIIPADAAQELRRVTIWVDFDHPLVHMQYHPSAVWLREHGYDPAMARGVHIPQLARFVELQTKNTQPAVVLHELAHAYHDQVLGFDDAPIRDAHRRAVDSKKYDEVLHIRGRRERHYALTTPQEFFAELSESYFDTNDFYPFVRAELAEFDPAAHRLLEEVWIRGRGRTPREPVKTDREERGP